MLRPNRLASLPPARAEALLYLLDAHGLSQELHQPFEMFACQLPCLLQSGITETALRWLLQAGLAEHKRERTNRSGDIRTFDPCNSLRFDGTSCFLLTSAGVEIADRLPMLKSGRARRMMRSHGPEPLRLPRYDSARRTLFATDQVVKQFRVPAKNQELILIALEEEHWPAHLDDPLPPIADVDQAKRLQHAIYRLNLRQRHRLIRFEANGKGTGITWCWIEG